jgi:hypothetical protein
MLTVTLDPGVGAKSVLFLKTERNSRYQWNFPGLAAKRETTLSQVHHRLFLKIRFLEANIYVTTLAFPAHILNAESEYGKGLLPHLQNEYGELGVNMAT